MAKANSQHSVHKLYMNVIDSVVRNLTATFLDTGVDDSIRQELREAWIANLEEMGTVTDYTPSPSSTLVGSAFGGNEPPPSINDFPAEPIFILPQSSKTMIPILIQKDNDADQTRTVNIPAGEITKDKLLSLIGLDKLDNEVATTSAKAMLAMGTRMKIPQGDGGLDDDSEIDVGEEEKPAELDDSIDSGGMMSIIPHVKVEVQMDDSEEEELEVQRYAAEFKAFFEKNKEMFYTQSNTIICQYEKVIRKRYQWKFVLKDGVMRLNGKDYVFGRAEGSTCPKS